MNNILLMLNPVSPQEEMLSFIQAIGFFLFIAALISVALVLIVRTIIKKDKKKKEAEEQ